MESDFGCFAIVACLIICALILAAPDPNEDNKAAEGGISQVETTAETGVILLSDLSGKTLGSIAKIGDEMIMRFDDGTVLLLRGVPRSYDIEGPAVDGTQKENHRQKSEETRRR